MTWPNEKLKENPINLKCDFIIKLIVWPGRVTPNWVLFKLTSPMWRWLGEKLFSANTLKRETDKQGPGVRKWAKFNQGFGGTLN